MAPHHPEGDDEDLFAFALPPLLSAHSGIVDHPEAQDAFDDSPSARPLTASPPAPDNHYRPWSSAEDEVAAAQTAREDAGRATWTAPSSSTAAAGFDLTPASALATIYLGARRHEEHARKQNRAEASTPRLPTGLSTLSARPSGMSDNGDVDYGVPSGWSLQGESRPRFGGQAEEARCGSKETVSDNGSLSGGRDYIMDADLLADVLSQDEDSPYPEVRASVSNFDDPDTPCLTARSWLLGISLSVLLGAANMFVMFRYPSPIITPIVALIISYPAGKLLAWLLPISAWSTPALLRRFGFGEDLSLNPGPFNIKEHTVIILMANVALSPVYAMHMSVAAEVFYDNDLGPGFDLVLAVSSQSIGFAVAGLCRRFLVWPASLLWPQNLALSTLLNTLHAEDDDGEGGTGISRYRFFCWAFAVGSVWYMLPGFLFQALSAFSWVCWMAPSNVVVNQLFGVSTGLGMSLLTFDWSQIAFLVSPLIVPWWAIVNVFVGFVCLFWVLAPAMYYSNVWNSAYLPISSNSVYDRFGMVYNTTQVLDKARMALNETAYDAYSQPYVPVTYSIYWGAAFALSTAALVHTAVYHGPDIVKRARGVKVEDEDVHMKLMRVYPEVPDWWYIASGIVGVALSLVAALAWDTTLPAWGVLLAIAFGSLFILPGGFIYALTATQLQINIPTQLISGFALPESPLAGMLFKVYALCSPLSGLSFVQDLKLGHYMKIPPRTTFAVQVIATTCSALAQVGVRRLLSANVPDFCSPTQGARLNCASTRVFYSASVIWGAVGPKRLFGMGQTYNPLLWGLIVGAVAPVATWTLSKRYPSSWLAFVNLPVALNGAMSMPPATGINYSSWFLTGLLFQYVLRRKAFQLWSKFGYLLSAAADSSTVISAIVIFLTLGIPAGGTIFLDWWGNTVFTRTADYQGVSFKSMPSEGYFA